MSISLIIIWILILLIMFGAGQRILDSLRLNDKEALIILILICVGLLIPPIWIGSYFCFSIGGFLIPFALSVYLLISCGWSRDLIRACIGTILVAGIIYALEWILPADPEDVLIDNMFVYGVVAGVVAYILSRSRRNAFVSCLFGVVLAQLIQWIINMASGTPSILGLGVGGAFGVYVVAIVISVAVSEFLGRCFECASKDNEDKVFNFETHTYDSEKNGKISADVSTKLNDVDKDKNRKTLLKTAKNAQKQSKNSKNMQKMAKENK